MKYFLAAVLLLTASVSCDVINGWEATNEVVDMTHSITVHFHLRHRNLDTLRKHAEAVSNPKDQLYGKYMNASEIGTLIGDEAGTAQVIQWALKQGCTAARGVATRDAVVAECPLSAAHAAFALREPFRRFRHARHPARAIHRSTAAPVLPEGLPIELVSGVFDFPPLGRHAERMEGVDTNYTAATLPIVLVEARSEGVVKIMYAVVCANGKLTNSTTPCLDYPPMLREGTLSITNYNQYQASAPNAHVFYNSTFAVQGCAYSSQFGKVLCPLPLPSGLPLDYVPFQLTTQSKFFGEGSYGHDLRHPYPVVGTPAYDVRTVMKSHNIPEHIKVTTQTATQSVAEFEQQYMNVNDLKLFHDLMGIENSAIANLTFIGPNNASNPGPEASLDTQWMMSIARDSPTTFWSIGANSTVEVDDILTWAIQVANATNPPLVHSVSYGMPEQTVDKFFGPGYLSRSDVQFQILANMGLTVIIACGDTGAYDMGVPPINFDTCEQTHPDWPSQSSFVTAVGSTYITPHNDPVCWTGSPWLTPNRERTFGMDCSGLPLGHVATGLATGLFWTTGGGSSNVVPMPEWQKWHVSRYLQKDIPFPAKFNRTGRMYPDLATFGHGLTIVNGGQIMTVDGTSASAPIWGAMVTLINSARIAAGKPPVGAFNNALYMIAQSTPAAFQDVRVGNIGGGAYFVQEGVRTDCLAAGGFWAAPGYDAASGLGAPDFEILLREAMKL